MNSFIKPVIVSFFALIAVLLMMFQTNVVTDRWTTDELNYALRTATWDATSVMMDDNYLFGTEEEPENFDIDLTRASSQFKDSFYRNIGSTVDANAVNDMNITLSGYAGYRYVYGVYGSGSETVPFGYTYTEGDTMYEFTLGDNIYTVNLADGMEDTLNLATLPENYFSATVSNENFRNITVMSSINNFLNVFYGDDANIVASNAGTGVRFELGTVDYAENDPAMMNNLSAVIDGPSFFAIVDIQDTRIDRLQRVMSIGAAELKYNSVTS